MNHKKRKWRTPQVPWTVHDVSNLVAFCDFVGDSSMRCKVGDGIFGDKYGDLGRNNSLPDCNRLPMLISIFDDNQCICLGASSNVGGVMTVHLCSMCSKYVHYHNTPPAPDPVKLDPHLSPLGEETTSTPVSKFYSNLSSDAVDQDPSVERLSNTAEQHESIQLAQGHIVSPAISRKDELMEWLVYLKVICKAPSYYHDQNVICIYQVKLNQTQGKTTLL
jgi:hypothetical protein